MRRRFVVAAAAAVAVAALAAAVRAQPPLAQLLVTDGRAIEYVRGLTAIGPRLTGSASYERAADWAAGELRAAGVERVGFEPFSIPDGWERE